MPPRPGGHNGATDERAEGTRRMKAKCNCSGCDATGSPSYDGWCQGCGLSIARVFGTHRMPREGYCSTHIPAPTSRVGLTAPWARGAND